MAKALWHPDADRSVLLPQGKFKGTTNVEGVVNHSAEGWLHVMKDYITTHPTKAWHASIDQRGNFYQHAPWNVALYHASSPYANFRFPGIEHEGIKGQMLTKEQGKTSVEVARWLCEEWDWPGLIREGDDKTLFEHNEVASESAPTSCPNGRIEWQYYVTEETNKMDYVFVRAEKPFNTLSGIAREMGYTLHALVALNPQITDIDLIYPGQALRLNGSVQVPPQVVYPTKPAAPNTDGLVLVRNNIATEVNRLDAEINKLKG